MDYGKMAYLKVDELEQQLKTTTVQERKFKSAYALCQPQKEIKEGNNYSAAYIKGSDAVSLVVKVSLDARSTGVLNLIVGGTLACSALINQIGKSYELFVQSVLTTDAAKLELSAASGLVGDVLSVDIVVSGINAAIIKTADILRLDGYESNLVMIKGKDERLEFFCGDVTIGEGEGIGFGSACDILAVAQNDYRAVYTDAFKNTWGLKLNNAGEVKRTYLTQGLDSVSLTQFDNKIIIGFVSSKGAGYFTTDGDFCSISEMNYFVLPQRAQSVLFVKNAAAPALVFNCGQKSFLKTAVLSDGADKSTVRVFVSTVSE